MCSPIKVAKTGLKWLKRACIRGSEGLSLGTEA